jgi:hypothetical protein
VTAGATARLSLRLLVAWRVIKQIEGVALRWARGPTLLAGSSRRRALVRKAAAVGVKLPICGAIEMERFEQAVELAVGELTPDAGLDSGHAERTEPDTAQAFDRDADLVHHPPHEVIDALMDDDLDHQTFGGLADDPDLLRHDPLAFDRDAVAQALDRGIRWSGEGEDVILLVEPVARMHDPIRHVPVVGQEQQTLGVAIEPPDRVDALRHRDQIHHGPAVAFVFGGRDIAARLVEQDVPRPLCLQDLAVDTDLRADRIRFRAELGDGHAIDADPACGNHLLSGAARADASRGEDALQPFHGSVGAPAKGFERVRGRSIKQLERRSRPNPRVEAEQPAVRPLAPHQ